MPCDDSASKRVSLSGRRTFDKRVRELAAQGLVRLPKRRLDWKAFFRLPAPKISVEQLQAAIEADREED